MSDTYLGKTLSSQIPLSLQFGTNELTYDSNTKTYTAQLNQSLPPCCISLNTLCLNPEFQTITSSMNCTLTIVNNGNTYTSTLGVGSWSFQNIVNFIFQQLVLNGVMLTNNLQQIWVPITLALSSSNNLGILTINPVPSSLPSGWTNSTGLVLTGYCPQISFSSDLNNLLGGGLPTSLYPVSTTQNFSSVLLTTNIPSNLYYNFKLNLLSPPVMNPYASRNGVPCLYQRYSNFVTDGTVETYEPQNRSWFYLSTSSSQKLVFQICDSRGVPVSLASNDIFINLDLVLGPNKENKLI